MQVSPCVTVLSMHREVHLLEQRYVALTSVSATYLGSTGYPVIAVHARYSTSINRFKSELKRWLLYNN